MDVVAIDKLPQSLCDLNLKHIIEKGYLEAEVSGVPYS